MSDLQVLLDTYLDDELTDQQHRELTAWIAADPGNVDLFVSQCRLDSYLLDIFGGEQLARSAIADGANDLGQEAPQQRTGEQTADREFQDLRRACGVGDAAGPSRFQVPFTPGAPLSQGNWLSPAFGYLAQGWPLAYLVAMMAVGIGLLIAAVMPVSRPVQLARGTGTVPSGVASRLEPLAVGRITGTVECRWKRGKVAGQAEEDESATPPLVAIGDRLTVATGLMEISYDTGAKVLLEGPVTYEIDSTTGGYLSVGKLTARLEQKSEVRGQRSEPGNQKSEITNHKSFVVRTPTATVTDLGTEFGVETDGNVTRSYVYQGQVEVVPRSGKDAAAKIRLTERQSITIDRTGVLSAPQPVDGRRFVRHLTVRPFGGSPDLAEGTVVFHEQFKTDSTNLAVDYLDLIYGPALPSTREAAGDTAMVSGGVLRLCHGTRADHTESVMTVQEFSGRMIVAVDIGADGMSINMSHVGLCLGDKTFVIHPGFSRDGVKGAFRTKKGGIGRTKDNADMGFVPQCNLMHHLYVYYDGESTFRFCLIDAANSAKVFRTTVVDRKCPRTFAVGVCRSGSMRTAMFDNLRVIQLPADQKNNPTTRPHKERLPAGVPQAQ